MRMDNVNSTETHVCVDLVDGTCLLGSSVVSTVCIENVEKKTSRH
ncbi:hypothetical protein AVEN_51487-1, partial [Araneus ventricosus]